MPADSLPTHQQLLSSLITSLSEPGECPIQADNPQPRHRTLLLTLHVLFPNIVLPALELIDNKLVTRLHVKAEPPDPSGIQKPCSSEKGDGGQDSLVPYAVQSLSSGPRELAMSKVHIVHLAAWNCSCDEFYRNLCYGRKIAHRWGTDMEHAYGSDSDGLSGALLSSCASIDKDYVPCCKHLLACLLVGRLTKSQDVSADRVFSKSEIATLLSGLQ